MAKTRYVFSTDPRRHPVRNFFKTLLIVLCVTVLIVTLFNLSLANSVKLVTEKVTVNNLPSGLESFTILVISDLHGRVFPSDQKSIVNALNSTPVSCIVFTGDVCDQSGDPSAFLSLVSKLPKDTRKYLVAGDEDPAILLSTAHENDSVFSSWAQQIQDAGVIILDEPMVETRGKCNLYLVPAYLYDLDLSAMESAYSARLTEIDSLVSPSANDLAQRRLCVYQLEKIERIRETMTSMTSKDIQVAITHVPMSAEYIRNQQQSDRDSILSIKNIALTVAGHYCGGNWRIPGTGALYVPEFGLWPDDRFIYGLSYHTGLWQYISPGLGTCSENPLPGRLFNQPTITILKLTSQL